ncbi:hypothetical protein [Methylobacterium haplocladii]|uniref:Phage gp6-like head-tail connector protein n=1 Tax=Methylobacterium haplocladii TaxID=1176176 RepID=A0A512ISG1_9HYPH|nr:hypothetical protein [Methylobacterium haplocladii]GEP00652.1 hypothetical protein MHA02_30390 [Methylobacterium haplocladii]GJD85415.1 hypothetical protein HPGCJGGD_3304 [Methylobacterium haplocladii]GLS57800.1 hypothetical protein GCM10007887_04560 [Methylobacterium haplocladii]
MADPTPPAIEPGPADLTTLAVAYGYLGIPAGTDDVGLQLAISAVSERIATWCSRSFVLTEHTETYDGSGNPRLLMRNFPITAIASLEIEGRPVSARSNPHGPGYVHDGRRTLDVYGYTFPRGRQNVSVTYTAGYARIPADLVMACLDWLKTGYLAQDRPADLVARKAGDHEERFAALGGVVRMGGKSIPMPPSVYAVLSQYQDTLPA